MSKSKSNDLEQLAQLLCPAGSGVYTVHSGAERRHSLQQQLYHSSDSSAVPLTWLKKLQEQMQAPTSSAQRCYFLGIPSDNGGGIHRGANWGPLYLRSKLLELFAPHYPHDLGDVRVIPHLLTDDMLSKTQLNQSRQALYQDAHSSLPVAPLTMAEMAADLFYNQRPHGILFGLGGDHSVSFPLVKSFFKNHKKRTAILHFDAHTDLLDRRLGVDICFGTWAHHALPLLAKPSDLLQIGIRSSGRDRSHWQQTLGVQQWWAQEILAPGGLDRCVQDILSYLKREGIEQLYVSFDIDVLDQQYAGATGTPEAGGPGPHHLAHIIDALSPHIRLAGADLVEVAPLVMPEEAPKNARDITLTNAVLFIVKLLEWANSKPQ